MGAQYFLYVRKSTDEAGRQVRSIDDQFAELREVAKTKNLDVVAEFEEHQSAKAPGRPVFNDMLARIERGEANGILAWHPDRLARNWIDGGRIIHLLDTQHLKYLYFPTVPFEPNPSGKFLLGILFGQSKYYVDNLSENIRRGQRHKLLDGLWPAHPPLGYILDPKTNVMIADPKRAPFVRAAFELYSTGTCTLDHLVQTVNKLGLTNRHMKPLSRAQYHRILTNPIYCGILRFGDQTSEGRHKPIVPMQLFRRCQSAIADRGKPKSLATFKPYLYRRIFRCQECGCVITSETQKGQNYLRCTKRVKRDCSQPYVHEERIAAQIDTFIRSVSLPADAADAMVERIREEADDDRRPAIARARHLRQSLLSFDQRFDRLLSLHLDDQLDLTAYNTKRSQLVHEKQSLKEEIQAYEAQSAKGWFEPAIRFISTLKLATDLSANGTDTEKRDFFRKTGSNLYIANGKIRVQPRGPWEIVMQPRRKVRGGCATCAALPARGAELVSDASRRRLLDNVRTFFKDNPAD